MALLNRTPKAPNGTVAPPKAKGKKGKAAAAADTGSWWEEAVEVPRSGLGDAEKLSRRAKRMRIWVRIGVLAQPILVLACIIALANTLRGTPVIDNTTPEQEAVVSRPAAAVAVRKWLAQPNQPLPGAVFIGWQSAERTESEGPDGEPIIVDVHTFSVAGGNGALYLVDVPMAVVGDVYSQISQPSLKPTIAVSPNNDGVLWPELEPTDDFVPETVETAINTWAAAYTGGISEELRLASQDADPEHYYLTLPGLTLSELELNQAADIDPENVPDENGNRLDPDSIIVNVSFVATWDGQDTDTQQDLPLMTFDLRLDNVRGVPYVSAWTGSGLGAELEAHSNAISLDVEIPTLDEGGLGFGDDAVTTPSATETAEAKGKKGKKDREGLSDDYAAPTDGTDAEGDVTTDPNTLPSSSTSPSGTTAPSGSATPTEEATQ